MQQFADAAGGQVRVVGVISKDGRPQAESFAADAGRHLSQRVRRGRRAHGRPRAQRAALHVLPRRRRRARLHPGRAGDLGRRAPRAGRRAPRGAAVTRADGLPDYLQRLIDAADDLPLRHRMPQADGDGPPLGRADPVRRGAARPRRPADREVRAPAQPRRAAGVPRRRRRPGRRLPGRDGAARGRGGGRDRPGRRPGAGHAAGAVPAAVRPPRRPGRRLVGRPAGRDASAIRTRWPGSRGCRWPT